MRTSDAGPTIKTLEPISILFSQYGLTVQQFADISGMNVDMVSSLSVTSTRLSDDGTYIKRNPLYDFISDEQYKRINDFFLVDLTRPNTKGECEIPFSANPDVVEKLKAL